MKKPANSNIYSYSSDAVLEAYEPWLAEVGEGTVCVASTQPLEEVAGAALRKSFDRLGYGNTACTFVALAGASAGQGERNSLPPLDATALFSLMEGVDPCVAVVADAHAAHVMEQAYRQEVPLDAPCRVFGRTCLAFRSFEDMLATPEGKQRAWALLKKLAR